MIMGKAQEVNSNAKETDARELKLKDLGLSGYTVNPLVQIGIETLEDVANKPKEFYKEISRYRKNSIIELEEILSAHGLQFAKGLESTKIEELELSPKVYNNLKRGGVTLICDLLDKKILFYAKMEERDTTEILKKLRNCGDQTVKADKLERIFSEAEKMRIKVKKMIRNNSSSIAYRFMEKTYSSMNVQYKRINFPKEQYIITTKERREYAISEQTNKIRSYFDSYMSKFEREAKDVYNQSVYHGSRDEKELFVEMAIKQFETTFKVLANIKKQFNKIVKEMKECGGLNIHDIYRLKFYFPLLIESEVCHSLVPHTNQECYVKNNEHYEIEYKSSNQKFIIELKYTAESVEKSIYKKNNYETASESYRTSLEERKKSSSGGRSYSSGGRSYSSGGRSNSSKSSSSVRESFGERVRSEVVGTAMFLSGFLPW